MNEQDIANLFDIAKANAIKLLKENDINCIIYPDVSIDFQADGLPDETDITLTTRFFKNSNDVFEADEPFIF